jgi:hypothetical protein
MWVPRSRRRESRASDALAVSPLACVSDAREAFADHDHVVIVRARGRGGGRREERSNCLRIFDDAQITMIAVSARRYTSSG